MDGMMNQNMAFGAGGSLMMFFAWVVYVLLIVLMVLGVAALWKYVTKK